MKKRTPPHPREWWILWIWTITATCLLIAGAFALNGFIKDAIKEPYENAPVFENKTVTFILLEKKFDGHHGNYTTLIYSPDVWSSVGLNYWYFENISEMQRMDLGETYRCRYKLSRIPGSNNTLSDCVRTDPEIFNISKRNG